MALQGMTHFYLNACTVPLPGNLILKHYQVLLLASVEVEILQQLVARKMRAAYWQAEQGKKILKHKMPLIHPCF